MTLIAKCACEACDCAQKDQTWAIAFMFVGMTFGIALLAKFVWGK